MEFRACEFSPDTDPSRPQVGANLEFQHGTFRIMKVGWVTNSELVTDLMQTEVTGTPSTVMARGEYDECICHAHPTRPGVHWLAWVNRVKP